MNKTHLLPRLIEIEELLSDKSRWTTNVSARNKYGMPIAPWYSDAVCWCLHGAISKVTLADEVSLRDQITQALLRNRTPYESEHYGVISTFNDHGGYHRVINLIRRTIKDLRGSV